MKANVETNVLPLERVEELPGGVLCLVVRLEGPHGWESWESFPKVLSYKGIKCAKSCYDSDRLLGFYRSDKLLAYVE